MIWNNELTLKQEVQIVFLAAMISSGDYSINEYSIDISSSYVDKLFESFIKKEKPRE